MKKKTASKFECVRLLTLCAFLVVGLTSTGCSKRYHNLPAFSAFPIYDSHNNSVGRFKTSYLADQIHAYYRGSVNAPIGVATFVDLDNLYGSSTFGRILGEQLMSELVMRGYQVVELRKADALQIMFGQGEFGLSRELSTLKGWHDLSGIVVGTYAASPLRVYVNSRLIDPATSLVASAGSVEMSKTREIARLLRANSMPPTMERIPVKHLGYSMYPMPYYWPQMRMFGYPNPMMPQADEGLYLPKPVEPSTDLPGPVPEELSEQQPPEPVLEPEA